MPSSQVYHIVALDSLWYYGALLRSYSALKVDLHHLSEPRFEVASVSCLLVCLAVFLWIVPSNIGVSLDSFVH